MYTVNIFDTSRKIFRTYRHINEIKYFDQISEEWVSISGSELLSHSFMSEFCQSYHLFSSSGNYTINYSLIGTFEVEKEN